MTLRVPPPRPFENVRINKRRVCPMCGEHTIFKRGWWHQICADIWNLVHDSGMLAIHGTRCWSCGQDVGRAEVDHVKPLWSLTRAERREIRWWLPFNLQILCLTCHKLKSAREAGERSTTRVTVKLLGTTVRSPD